MSGALAIASAGWPFTLALAAVLVARNRAEARRVGAIGRAVHELRRPLHALALATPPHAAGNGNGGPAPLELAARALDDLEWALTGRPAPPRRRLLRLRPLVEDCVERWHSLAGPAVGAIGLEWRAGAAAVVADPGRLAQALDNLVLNAIEHGEPPIVIAVAIRERGVSIVVGDRGPRPLAAHAARKPRRGRGSRDAEPVLRGHGLGIVASIAADHGGRFAIGREDGVTRAVLELPLASLPIPAAADTPAA